MFAVAASPRPSDVLPAGQRSVFSALSKARRDVAGAARRRDREQSPGRFLSSSAAVEAAGVPAPDDGGNVASSPVEGQAPASAVEGTSMARRGLVGLLFSSRGR